MDSLISVSRERLDELINLLHPILATTQGPPEAERWIQWRQRVLTSLQRIEVVSLKLLEAKCHDLVENLGIRLKKSASLEFFGFDLEVDAAALECAELVLLHGLRNAMAHGVVPVRKGRLRVSGEISESRYFQISLDDDGPGPQAKDTESLARLFDAEVSTQSQPDEVSGRGVGLAAIKNAVVEAGGEVQARINPSGGFRLLVKIPVQCALLRAHWDGKWGLNPSAEPILFRRGADGRLVAPTEKGLAPLS